MTAVAMAPAAPVLWRPNEGPQRRFLASTAFECLYGGAAGGGKTDALLYGLLRQTHHPQFRGLFLRRTYPELREVMDRALSVFSRLGAQWSATERRWRFPSSATIEFGYCETWADAQRYQGQEYTVIAFDELGQLAEERVWLFLMSRCRSTAADLVLMMRASANPGGAGHAWLKRRFVVVCPPDGGHYTDPATGLTRAFVAARLVDNPALERDGRYRQTLEALPDMLRRQLLDGDWDAGEGLALDELRRDVHLVSPFEVPQHWTLFGAFDWGFAHPYSFGLFCANEAGDVWLVDSAIGRREHPPAQAWRMKRTAERARLDWGRVRYVSAGHDCWADHRARGENVPTIAEQLFEAGVPVARANISRVSGLNNLRRYVAIKNADGTERTPRFRIMDTPANRRVFDCLSGMVTDPDDPEDALKVDADAQSPLDSCGGDDLYDMVRYGLASRPLAAEKLAEPVDWADRTARDPIAFAPADQWEQAGTLSQFPHGL